MNIRRIAYVGAILLGTAVGASIVAGETSLIKAGDSLSKAAQNGAFSNNFHNPDAALPLPPISMEAPAGRVLAHFPPKTNLRNLAAQAAKGF